MTFMMMLAAAAGVLLWPNKKNKDEFFLPPLPEFELSEPAPAATPTYQKAMQHLAAVRQRLVHTGELTADCQSAFEVLTLELLTGSDR